MRGCSAGGVPAKRSRAAPPRRAAGPAVSASGPRPRCRSPRDGRRAAPRPRERAPGRSALGSRAARRACASDEPEPAPASRLRKIQATRIPSRYSTIIGRANTHCVATSGVGVITAATMKMIRTAYLNLASSQRSETMPSRARKKTRIGISKHSPRPRISLVAMDRYSLIVMTAWKGLPTPTRKPTTSGKGLVVRERAARQEEHGPEDHERQDPALLAAVEGGRDEEPDLPEHDRRGDQRCRRAAPRGSTSGRARSASCRPGSGPGGRTSPDRPRQELEELRRPVPGQRGSPTKTATIETISRLRSSSRCSKNPIRGQLVLLAGRRAARPRRRGARAG